MVVAVQCDKCLLCIYLCQLHCLWSPLVDCLGMAVSKGSFGSAKKAAAQFATRSGLAFVFDPTDSDHVHVPWVNRLHADVLPDGNTQITDFFTCTTKTIIGDYSCVELDDMCLACA